MRVLSETLERMMRRIFPSRVSFDDGSHIEFLNREAIIYTEKDGHQMEVPWYFQRGHMKGRVLNARDIKHWDSPYETELLSSEKKEDIQRKIVEYCHKRKIPLRIK
jgi:hypothetical protein